MLRKITEIWPDLIQQYQGVQPDEEDAEDETPDAQPEEDVNIKEAFRNMRWTRVIALRNYKEEATHVFSMADDIVYCKQRMDAIKLENTP